MKIILGIVVPLVAALLLNEVTRSWYKRTVQTIIYFPYFISWVILSGILSDILSPSTGIVNSFLGLFGMEPVYFLGNENAFPWVVHCDRHMEKLRFQYHSVSGGHHVGLIRPV